MAKTLYQILDDQYILKKFVSDRAWKRWGAVKAEDDQNGIVGGDAEYLQLRDGRQIAKPLTAEHLPLLEDELAKYSHSCEWLSTLHHSLLRTAARGLNDLHVSENLDSWFHSIQEKAKLKTLDQTEVQEYSKALYRLRNLVPNGLCAYWVVHIPRAVPTRRMEFASIGRAMSQVAYLEALGKKLDMVLLDSEASWDNWGLARASLYIRIADEVMADAFSALPN